MAKKIDRKIVNIVLRFVAEIKKHYDVHSCFLFGSFAKGNQHDASDIDVAIVSSDVGDVYFDMVKMMKYGRSIDFRIEPHPIHVDDYRSNATALVNEIKTLGVQLYAA